MDPRLSGNSDYPDWVMTVLLECFVESFIKVYFSAILYIKLKNFTWEDQSNQQCYIHCKEWLMRHSAWVNIALCVGEYRTMRRQKLDTRRPVPQSRLLIEEEASLRP